MQQDEVQRQSAPAGKSSVPKCRVRIAPSSPLGKTAPPMGFDVVLRGGTVYDGTGGPPETGVDVAISGDSIAAVRRLEDHEIADAGEVLDVSGRAVAPGFINVLSHSYASILRDPRSLSELTQGVTTQIMGEGSSMGPITDEQRTQLKQTQGIDADWNTLAEFLAHVEQRGTSQNVGSLLGASTLRIVGCGYENRPMRADELDRVRAVIAEEMQDGALGIGSALIYPPGNFASTEELVELCRVAGAHGGRYFSHMRSEAAGLLDGIDELRRISREAEIPAEVWHLKAAGRPHWPKMAQAIEKIETAQAAGEPIGANFYPYTAGGTGLAACIPPRYADGGPQAMRERLRDPKVRSEIRDAIATDTDGGWENLYALAGSPDRILVAYVREKEWKQHQGRTLAAVAADLGVDPLDALLEMVAETSYVGCMYFLMSEENVRLAAAQPWCGVGSDAASIAPDGEEARTPAHPRTYGTFARFLGTYVRDEGVCSLADGVRRMTLLPATNLGLDRRGRLAEDWFADVVVFDPATIADRATYEDPHQLAVGVDHVLVNGSLALRDGKSTGTFAGRALAGRGKRR
jgi:N-acyl-D-amino-acid deacylase